VSSEPSRPSWQLPPGVSKGAWDYVTQSHIASQYDAFHQGHPLLDLDRELVLEVADRLASSSGADAPIALDLGCGTGRTVLPLIERGWRAIGVDLSSAMLACAAAKRAERQALESSSLVLVRSNMAQLEFLSDACVQLATCLYSSIGMVQGRKHRRRVFEQVARTLRDDGRFIVHVHNRGIWARDPGGLLRMVRDRWRSVSDAVWEYGDRVYAYRGLPSMYLHIYSERELRSDLRHAGLRVERILPLNITSSGPLRFPRWFRALRTGGFFAIAKPALR
jgi:SAM-dependent methyltransferase